MAYTPKVWKDNSSGNTPITAAELNRMEEGIQGGLVKSGLEFVQMVGSRVSNCEYAVFKQSIANSAESDFTASHFYILEGWAKCIDVSEDGLSATFGFTFSGLSSDIASGYDMFWYSGEHGISGGIWYSVLDSWQLGYMDDYDYGFMRNPYRNKNALSALVSLDMSITSYGSGSLISSFICSCTATAEQVDNRVFFSQEDIDNKLTVRFKLKLVPIIRGDEAADGY
jgi:hypothetical protein